MRCHLRVFVNYHMKWMVKVGTNILKKKGLDIYDYVNDLDQLTIPLDQLGRLILARTYHYHITVFCKDYVWTMRSDNSMRDCTAYLVYKGGVNFIASVPDYVVPSTNDRIKIVGSTPVKTPSNKRKTVSTNRIITKRRRMETDSVSVFRIVLVCAGQQTRNSKREKCCLSLDKVLKQYRSSISLLDTCNYNKFVAGKYSKENPGCNDQQFLSDVAYLVS